MKNSTIINTQFFTWLIISITLLYVFINYGKNIQRNHPNKKEKDLQKFRWTITIITLLCIYIVEENINNIEERRLINCVIIFASTFSYLYFLKLINNTSPTYFI